MLLEGMCSGAATVENSVVIPQKLNRVTIYAQNLCRNTHSITHNSQKVETPKCLSADEWIKKMWCVCIMDCYLAV